MLRALWCLLIPALMLVGCGQASHEGVRFGLAAAPVTLDPRFATDASSVRINRLLYRRLVEFDDAARPVPGIAHWTRVTPILYRFHLGEEGRAFSDGTRLTARDVKATYDYILDPANASPHRASLTVIARIEVTGADQVDFHLRHADLLFPGRLVHGILPAALIAADHPFNREPVGSGAFALQDWPQEGRLRLRRRTDGLAVEFLVVKDPTVRVLKILRGELDIVQGDLPPELVGYLAARPEVRVSRARGSTFAYLGFNLQDPEVGRLEVRRAIAYALDREGIIRHVLGGAARPAAALLPPDHWAGFPAAQGYPHDPRRARTLLRAAGLDGPGRLRISYKTSSDPLRVRLATIIQRQLGEVGIAVDLRSYDWGTFYGDIKSGRFQMFSLAWVGIKTPDIFKYVFYSASVPPAGANRGRYHSAAADRLIERAEAATSWEQQAALYRELQALLLEDLPYIPLWYEDQVCVARRTVRGYRVAGDGNYDGLIALQM